MPRLGRKLLVEITDRSSGESELVSEGEGIRRLSRGLSHIDGPNTRHREAQMLLENAADSHTAVLTNFFDYTAQWDGEPRTALKVVGWLSGNGHGPVVNKRARRKAEDVKAKSS
jgi:hypothetical protein